MNIVKDVLSTVSNYPGGYRLIYDLIYKKKNTKIKEQSVRNILSRMKKKGLLSNKNGTWKITQEGKDLLKEKQLSIFMKFSSRKNSNKKLPKTTIIVFDIPEKKRLYRDWLRSELVNFGFELVQKSVWFGPTLPREFIKYLGERNILEYVRFFKVTEKDLI
jgi:DNA-binding transcriptional regulator PaaX